MTRVNRSAVTESPLARVAHHVGDWVIDRQGGADRNGPSGTDAGASSSAAAGALLLGALLKGMAALEQATPSSDVGRRQPRTLSSAWAAMQSALSASLHSTLE